MNFEDQVSPKLNRKTFFFQEHHLENPILIRIVGFDGFNAFRTRDMTLAPETLRKRRKKRLEARISREPTADQFLRSAHLVARLEFFIPQ